MIHFVYETTNLINDKKYIGKHSTNNLDDGYLGSGTLLLRAIKKYGRENFKREIIMEYQDEKQAFDMEKFYVNRRIIKDPMYYNIVVGGDGYGSGENHPMYGKHLTEEIKKKMSEAKKGKHRTEKTKKKMSEARKGENNPMYGRTGENHPMYGSKRSKETVKKMSKSLKGNKRRLGKYHTEKSKKKMSEAKKGKNNSFYGKYHTEKSKKKMSEAHKGGNNSQAKLTEKDVIDIKQRLQKGEHGVDIAKDYNVSRHHISAIKLGRKWGHIKI